MNIGVVGTGYVGLVVGTCLAESGSDVICVDSDEKKIQALGKGKPTIYEPGLAELLRKNIQEKRLSFSTDLEMPVRKSDVIFLALPTPQSEDGSADLKHVMGVVKKIGKYVNGYKVIANKSTVPVGTAAQLQKIIFELSSCECDVVSNPEFLKEGAAINDFMKPDRIIIGSQSANAIRIMQDLYAPFVRTGNPILVMDDRSAELTKYASNAFLAAKVSFMNELANLCERVGADVDMVRKGMGSDPRIGSQFLFPGVGYGGSCFPKDVSALARIAKDHNYDFKIVESIRSVNAYQKKVLIQKMKRYFGKSLGRCIVAVWGLSFKPNTDDVREAPSLTIIEELLKRGVRVHVHDPVAMDQARKILGASVKYFENNYDALKGTDALLIVTEWNEFRRPDFERMKSLMRRLVVFDGRNIYDPAVLAEKGFTYFGIGRGGLNAES